MQLANCSELMKHCHHHHHHHHQRI